MKTRKLGRTGLDVSPPCLGCVIDGLSEDETAMLEAPYVPHAPVGFT